MTGLTLEDMRRIGKERSARHMADAAAAGDSKSLFRALPNLKRHKAQAVKPAVRAGIEPKAGDAVAPVEAMPVDRTVLADLEDQAQKVLRGHRLRLAGTGMMSGVLLGALSGLPLLMIIGGAVGLGGGLVMVQRLYSVDAEALLKLKPSQHETLYGLVGDVFATQRLPGPSALQLSMTGRIRVAISPPGLLFRNAKVTAILPYPLLASVDQERLRPLLAMAIHRARHAGMLESAERSCAALKALAQRSRRFPGWLVGAKTDDLDQKATAFDRSLIDARRSAILAADTYAAAAYNPALTAQSVLAETLCEAILNDTATPLAERLVRLRAKPDEGELKQVFAEACAAPQSVDHPVSVTERLSALDSSASVPLFPAPANVADSVFGPDAERLVERLDKKGPGKSRKSKTARSKPRPAEAPVGSTQAGTEKAGLARSAGQAKRFLFSRLNPFARYNRKRQPDSLSQADALLSSGDTKAATKAYRDLLSERPNWAVLRLRLGDALLSQGDPAAAEELLRAAEELPGALPDILGLLDEAARLIGPAEAAELHQTIDALKPAADAAADERGSIDLAHLNAHSLDEDDERTLSFLLDSCPQLSEAWVFASPCRHFPATPHHAVIALAPRLSPNEATETAFWLAERAGVRGTVAVHIEIGVPQGLLGDQLASNTSFWRR